MTAPYRIELLADHDRGAFACGEEALDRYFKTLVTQDVRRRLATCFVAVGTENGAVAGFYTLAACGIPTPDLPDEIVRRLPRYPTIPAVRIGRLAVDGRHGGQGLGGALLADAAVRAMASPVAAFALLVDAKSDAAVAFYEHHGFLPLARQPRTLLLPLSAALKRPDVDRWRVGGRRRSGRWTRLSIATCERNDVNPLAYLNDVLLRVQRQPAKQIDDLLPQRWKPERGPTHHRLCDIPQGD